MNLQTFNWSLPFHACKSYLPIFHACKSATKNYIRFTARLWSPSSMRAHAKPPDCMDDNSVVLKYLKVFDPKKSDGFTDQNGSGWLKPWNDPVASGFPMGKSCLSWKTWENMLGLGGGFGAPWFGILGVPISNNPFQLSSQYFKDSSLPPMAQPEVLPAHVALSTAKEMRKHLNFGG